MLEADFEAVLACQELVGKETPVVEPDYETVGPTIFAVVHMISAPPAFPTKFQKQCIYT